MKALRLPSVASIIRSVRNPLTSSFSLIASTIASAVTSPSVKPLAAALSFKYPISCSIVVIPSAARLRLSRNVLRSPFAIPVKPSRKPSTLSSPSIARRTMDSSRLEGRPFSLEPAIRLCMSSAEEENSFRFMVRSIVAISAALASIPALTNNAAIRASFVLTPAMSTDKRSDNIELLSPKTDSKVCSRFSALATSLGSSPSINSIAAPPLPPAALSRSARWNSSIVEIELRSIPNLIRIYSLIPSML